MIKDLFKGLPNSLQVSLEAQVEETMREMDELHRSACPNYDFECIKLCAKMHAILGCARRFRYYLEDQLSEAAKED